MPDPGMHVTEIKQEHRPERNPETGGTHEVWRISFRSPSGTRGFVEVPDAQYKADHIAELINAKIREIERVHDMAHREPGK